MPAAALSGEPEITDNEEVTGSNPVSATTITPGQNCVSDAERSFGAWIG
jgi:hypothetical protein